MIEITFIRHGTTAGNSEKKYIGRTDELLTEQGQQILRQKPYPRADMVFVSPLRRCTESSLIIYPELEPIIVEEFAECDFGEFEGKTAAELAGHPVYADFLKTGSITKFPAGEEVAAFKARCIIGFEKMAARCLKAQAAQVSCIIHGGTIMSLMEHYTYPSRSYYQWQLRNGEGYTVIMDGSRSGFSLKAKI